MTKEKKDKKVEEEVKEEKTTKENSKENETEESVEDSDMPIFEGGPTQSEVDNWKKAHGEVYVNEIADDSFVIWRPLTRHEFKTLSRQQESDPLYKEERVCDICKLWPKNESFVSSKNGPFGSAGAATTLSEHIMQQSGFIMSDPIKL